MASGKGRDSYPTSPNIELKIRVRIRFKMFRIRHNANSHGMVDGSGEVGPYRQDGVYSEDSV
jgi:hypothetical protein